MEKELRSQVQDKDVPYIVYEATQARNERTIRRLIIVVIVAIVLLFASNAIWLYAWMQYDYVATSEDYSIDLSTKGGGDANYIGNDGDINNGKGSSEESADNGPAK